MLSNLIWVATHKTNVATASGGQVVLWYPSPSVLCKSNNHQMPTWPHPCGQSGLVGPRSQVSTCRGGGRMLKAAFREELEKLCPFSSLLSARCWARHCFWHWGNSNSPLRHGIYILASVHRTCKFQFFLNKYLFYNLILRIAWEGTIIIWGLGPWEFYYGPTLSTFNLKSWFGFYFYAQIFSKNVTVGSGCCGKERTREITTRDEISYCAGSFWSGWLQI